MTYPNDGPPVGARVLEQIRADIAAIAPPSYHSTVREVHVYDGTAITMGLASGAFALVYPGEDRTDDSTTGMIRHHLDVQIVAGVRSVPNSGTWKDALRWLVSDIGQAFEQDKQLGGFAAYIEPLAQEIYNAGATDPIAVCRLDYRVEYRHAWDNPSLVT